MSRLRVIAGVIGVCIVAASDWLFYWRFSGLWEFAFLVLYFYRERDSK